MACASQASDPTATPAFSAAVATQVEVNLTAAVSTLPPAAPPTQIPKPTGFLVVYPKADGLWAWMGAEPVQLTTDGSDAHPRLSADGQLVVFQRGAQLWVLAVSDLPARQLYAEAGGVPLQFDFAPASHSLYFTTAGADDQPRFDLNLAAENSPAARNLLPAGQGGQFTFSPDGKLLALVQPAKISTARADGTTAQVVYQFQPVKGLRGPFLPQIAWLENGFGFKTVLPGVAGQPARFLFLTAAGGPPAQLAVFPAAAPSVSEAYLAPDGSKVVYAREAADKLVLHIIDASTADKAYFGFARGKFGLLGWTPDSKQMLFWVDDPRQAWVSAGENSAPVSDVTYAEHLTWLDTETFLFLNGAELRMRTFGEASQLIDTGVTGEFAALKIR